MAAMEIQHAFFLWQHQTLYILTEVIINYTWQTMQCRLCCEWKPANINVQDYRGEHHHTKSWELVANTLT